MAPNVSLALGELAQDHQEVGHNLASARFAVVDDPKRDAFLRDVAGLLEQLGKPPAA